MSKTKKKWDLISEETRKRCIEDTIDFFYNEHDQEIGIITAGNILDFFLESIAMEIYNLGVDDSMRLLRERFEGLEMDLESIKK